MRRSREFHILEDFVNPCATGRKNAFFVVSGAGGELRFVNVRLD